MPPSSSSSLPTLAGTSLLHSVGYSGELGGWAITLTTANKPNNHESSSSRPTGRNQGAVVGSGSGSLSTHANDLVSSGVPHAAATNAQHQRWRGLGGDAVMSGAVGYAELEHLVHHSDDDDNDDETSSSSSSSSFSSSSSSFSFSSSSSSSSGNDNGSDVEHGGGGYGRESRQANRHGSRAAGGGNCPGSSSSSSASSSSSSSSLSSVVDHATATRTERKHSSHQQPKRKQKNSGLRHNNHHHHYHPSASDSDGSDDSPLSPATAIPPRNATSAFLDEQVGEDDDISIADSTTTSGGRASTGSVTHEVSSRLAAAVAATALPSAAPLHGATNLRSSSRGSTSSKKGRVAAVKALPRETEKDNRKKETERKNTTITASSSSPLSRRREARRLASALEQRFLSDLFRRRPSPEVSAAASAAVCALGKLTNSTMAAVRAEMRLVPAWCGAFNRWSSGCCKALVETAVLNGWLAEVGYASGAAGATL